MSSAVVNGRRGSPYLLTLCALVLHGLFPFTVEMPWYGSWVYVIGECIIIWIPCCLLLLASACALRGGKDMRLRERALIIGLNGAALMLLIAFREIFIVGS